MHENIALRWVLTTLTFPDVTDPEKLEQIKTITYNYMKEPEQMEKLGIIADILKGRGSCRSET